METIRRAEMFNQNFFTGLRTILENSFTKKTVNHKVTAEIILNEFKLKEFDSKKFINLVKNLSEEEWSKKYVITVLTEMNEIVGISDHFIRKNACEELKSTDLMEIKWEMMKKIIIDYARFSKEFYDILKYSRNLDTNRDRRLLLYTFMEALSKIHESSKVLLDKYYTKRYNRTSFKKIMDIQIPIEHLLLRIYFILFNINNLEKLRMYRSVLSSEIIEYSMQK